MVLPGIQYCICGGYRRGKPWSSDVDIIITHPKENATKGLLHAIIKSLESTNFITHTLTVSTASQHREGDAPRYHFDSDGHGIGALDTGLVVILFPTESSYYTKIHRRLDIIIAPWHGYGTAIVGWTGGTTFERDLRLWAKTKKDLKFDSSGIHDRKSAQLVNTWDGLEAGCSPEEVEKKVFGILGLEYISPHLRNTM
jgi:DNA polymerase IV